MMTRQISVNPAVVSDRLFSKGGEDVGTVVVVYRSSFWRCSFIGWHVEDYRQRKIRIRLLPFLSGTGSPLFG